MALFRRVNRGVYLTDAGQNYLPAGGLRLLSGLPRGELWPAEDHGFSHMDSRALHASRPLTCRVAAAVDQRLHEIVVHSSGQDWLR